MTPRIQTKSEFQTKQEETNVTVVFVVPVYIGCVSNTWAPLWTANIECLNIHGTHVTANTSTNNNAVFFSVSDLKRVYDNSY